jgi:hypothetical protein
VLIRALMALRFTFVVDKCWDLRVGQDSVCSVKTALYGSPQPASCLFCRVWSEQYAPQAWRVVDVILIPKAEGTPQANPLSCATLLSVVEGKLLQSCRGSLTILSSAKLLLRWSLSAGRPRWWAGYVEHIPPFLRLPLSTHANTTMRFVLQFSTLTMRVIVFGTPVCHMLFIGTMSPLIPVFAYGLL